MDPPGDRCYALLSLLRPFCVRRSGSLARVPPPFLAVTGFFSFVLFNIPDISTRKGMVSYTLHQKRSPNGFLSVRYRVTRASMIQQYDSSDPLLVVNFGVKILQYPSLHLGVMCRVGGYPQFRRRVWAAWASDPYIPCSKLNLTKF